MENKIHYGFGKDYLSNWGVQEALREIYQNFLDYDNGNYTEVVTLKNNGRNLISVTNDWIPLSLDFLRIGNSKKQNVNAIGKHGEGLKMAFLILERLGLKSRIFTPKFVVYPSFYLDKEIGECFCLIYKEHSIKNQKYTIQFECHKEDFSVFKDNLITKEDIIYSHHYGDILNKEAGKVYSGGLFVAKCENMTKAYNIKPQYLPLDRDRCVPRAFDVSYYSSIINVDYGKITTKDLSYSDTQYMNKIPDEIKKEITPKIIGNSIEFTYKDEEGNDKIITNSSAKDAIKQDSFFTAALKKLKIFMAKKLGLYDMLLQFREKHVHTSDAIADFDLILERLDANSLKQTQD